MIRKSLFWGLTLVLIVALVTLIARSYKQEKAQARQPTEIVKEAKPTATRVLAPQDLEVLSSKMVLERDADVKEPAYASRHEIEIHNSGRVSYREIQLRFTYLGRSGKALVIKTHSVVQTILPGTTLKLRDIKVSGLPISAVNLKTAIMCADIAPASAMDR